MARPFDSTDAKRIIERHRKLLAELVRAEESFDGLRTAITKTSDELVAQEVLKVLKDIPVDELNRDKRGIRIKLLSQYLTNVRLTVRSSPTGESRPRGSGKSCQ